MTEVFREERPQAVLNLAAETHVDRSIDSPQPFIDTNITGVFVLLETARQFMAGQKADAQTSFRFLHVSTDEVYGSLGTSGLFSEETPYAPTSPYAANVIRRWRAASLASRAQRNVTMAIRPSEGHGMGDPYGKSEFL